MIHPWHDLHLGDNPSEMVECVIEVPKGSKNKYELDKKSGMLRLDRVLYSSVHYPANYGFLPRTFCDDGDALDVLVFGQAAVVPLCIVRARPIGLISMRDEKGQDDKLIAVAVDDPEFKHYQNIDELPPHRFLELRRFFLDYKALEDKEVDVDQLRGHKEAVRAIEDAMALYESEVLPHIKNV